MSLSEPPAFLSITYEGTEDDLNKAVDKESTKQRILPFANSPIFKNSITKIKQLTKGEDVKAVYDISLDVQNNGYNFEPGDTIGILPYNDHQEVEQLLARLNLKSVATLPYRVSILKDTTKKKPTVPAHIPLHGSLQELFLKNLDIRSIPKKIFLRSLIKYTTDKEEVEKLQLLCSPSGSEEYNKFITNNRTLLHLLMAFPSCQPPVERLLENLPPLQPRPYSISSSPLMKELHITFAVIKTDWGAKGVCSGWLENLSTDIDKQFSQLNIKSDGSELLNTCLDKTIEFYYRKTNKFRLPSDPLVPIIMIGPGTGVAPFIGFLQHRYLLNKQTMELGPSWLFYGCRYSERDFLYKKEIEQYLQSGILTKLFTCFSREGTKKMYVQDLIKEHGKDFINKIVREDAIVYVCGDAKNMAKDVRKTVVSCLVDFEGLSESDAEAFVQNLEQTSRYILDVWV